MPFLLLPSRPVPFVPLLLFLSLSLALRLFSTSNSLQLGFPVPLRLLFSLPEA